MKLTRLSLSYVREHKIQIILCYKVGEIISCKYGCIKNVVTLFFINFFFHFRVLLSAQKIYWCMESNFQKYFIFSCGNLMSRGNFLLPNKKWREIFSLTVSDKFKWLVQSTTNISAISINVAPYLTTVITMSITSTTISITTVKISTIITWLQDCPFLW